MYDSLKPIQPVRPLEADLCQKFCDHIWNYLSSQDLRKGYVENNWGSKKLVCYRALRYKCIRCDIDGIEEIHEKI
jgi:hypothetical protein